MVLDSALPPVSEVPINPAPVRQRNCCYIYSDVGHTIIGVTASAVGREHASGQHNLPFGGCDRTVLGDEIPFPGAMTCKCATVTLVNFLLQYVLPSPGRSNPELPPLTHGPLTHRLGGPKQIGVMSVGSRFACRKQRDGLHTAQVGPRSSQRHPQPGDSLHVPRAAVQGYVWPALTSPM